jgi:hypothetical protein
VLASLGLLAAMALTNHASNLARQAYAPSAASYDQLASYLMAHGRDQSYVASGLPASDIFFQYGMADMKQSQPGGAAFSLPFAQAATAFNTPRQVAGFDASCACMRPLPWAEAQPPGDPAALISASIARPDRVGARWKLASPLPQPAWYLYFPKLNVALKIDLPEWQIGYTLPPWMATPMRVVVRSPSGQWAMTPELNFPAQGQTLHYP